MRDLEIRKNRIVEERRPLFEEHAQVIRDLGGDVATDIRGLAPQTTDGS